MENWQKPEYCGDLGTWIDDNWNTIVTEATTLIESDRECLYPIARR